MHSKTGFLGISAKGALTALAFATCLGATSLANSYTIVSQLPPNGGGIGRWSKLWIDMSGQGNDLDGDAICYEDFVLTRTTKINHIEWWGDATPNHGFQIEFWRQDPGTSAYQPLGVFRSIGAQPEFMDTFLVNGSFDATGTYHYSLDLPQPVTLAANNSSNPRWFISIIGLTDVAYLEWNWAQGLGGSSRTFQFVRGGNEGGGDLYRVLSDGRAMILKGVVPRPPMPPVWIKGWN